MQYKKRFLIARCQGSDLPARLEVFAVVGDIKSTVASKLQELSFNELKEVFVANEGSSREATKKLIILQTQEGEDVKFYSSSEVEHNTWYIYCYVLANIPTYPIPDVSHYQIPLDTFKQEMDPKRLNAGKPIALCSHAFMYIRSYIIVSSLLWTYVFSTT